VAGSLPIGRENRNPAENKGDIVCRVSLLGRDVPSFRLMGEDLVALSPDRLRHLADEYDAELERHVPPSLHDAVREERTDIAREAHELLSRYNTSIHTRVRGYVALGQRLDFEYPWPVVAVLGITQVMRTLHTVHLLGLAGSALERVGHTRLTETVERTDDVLKRTNRCIFADSVPTVTFALRCHSLRREGRADVAQALLAGPRMPWMDGEAVGIATRLYEGLAVADPEERFRCLSDLTLTHFAREQAILSFHMGVRVSSSPPRPRKSWVARMLDPKSVYAPRIRNHTLELAPFPLPDGFEMKNHERRVAVFGEAFVTSITRERHEYEVARDWVVGRFGK
jgi:hypothetical protein